MILDGPEPLGWKSGTFEEDFDEAYRREVIDGILRKPTVPVASKELLEHLEILKAAREGCSQPGMWCQGAYATGKSRCAVGWLKNSPGAVEEGCSTMVTQYLVPVLPDDFRGGDFTFHNVIGFNDHPTTTQDDVIALFDRAIARLEGMIEGTVG